MIDQALLLEQLIQHEGLRLLPYVDSVGKLTIGIGRNLTDKGISRVEAMVLCANDISECELDLQTFYWFTVLSPVRQRALLDMRFNVGPGGFRGFHNMLAALARHDYPTAARELLNSKMAQQTGARAVHLAQMIHSNTVPA